MFILLHTRGSLFSKIFFFNDTATTEIYTLSLHDALPISETLLIHQDIASEFLPRVFSKLRDAGVEVRGCSRSVALVSKPDILDRKSTRLNSSHGYISYAVFCLKKKINVMIFRTLNR